MYLFRTASTLVYIYRSNHENKQLQHNCYKTKHIIQHNLHEKNNLKNQNKNTRTQTEERK